MTIATTESGSRFRAASRLGAIGVSEILRITAEAAALKRAGRPLIVLGAGEPDFDTPEHIEDAAGSGRSASAAISARPSAASEWAAVSGRQDARRWRPRLDSNQRPAA